MLNIVRINTINIKYLFNKKKSLVSKKLRQLHWYEVGEHCNIMYFQSFFMNVIKISVSDFTISIFDAMAGMILKCVYIYQ